MPKPQLIERQSFRLAVLLVVTLLLAYAALVLPQQDEIYNLNLQAGNVAPQDIQAPFGITYESLVLTTRQREIAASTVAPVYTSPDTRIARQQAEKMRAALTYITSVRADQFATREEKLADLMLVEGGSLPGETAIEILDLTSEQWQIVQQEAVLVLQQVQQSAIRPEQVSDAIRSIPALVSLSIPDTQTGIVSDLVTIYVAPNSFFSEELTENKRIQAAESILPVERSFVAGETIVNRGRVLTDEDIEALDQFGLLSPADAQLSAIKAVLVLSLSASIAIIFFYRSPDVLIGTRQQIFLAAVFLLFLYAARLMILGHVVLPFIYPVAAFGLLLASLFNSTPGILLPISLSLLITFGMPNALELSVYYITSTIFGVLILGNSQRTISFFWAGVGAAVLGAAMVVANRLLDPGTDIEGLTTLIGAALIYGLSASGLTLLLQFFAAQWLGKTTNLQLVELSRPDHPLLRYILLNAPGTYQHSLQVANLAEQAAEQIGANPLLTRVGALYHDCGKAINPQYFIENQVPGTPNLHDSLSPLDSARIIINHVIEGAELARKHRLPKPILAFILEHHGTTMTKYQYGRAVNEALGDSSLVDEDDFYYPGPRPQSRETALVMLADGSEARTRAQRPPTEHALRELIKDTIDTRIAEHQLNDVNLTPKDLNIILEIFTSTLKGVYHPRLEYPTLDQKTQPRKPAEMRAEPAEAPKDAGDEH